MTQSEFNRLLSSINGLSPEQLRLLRCELDNKLASPATPAALPLIAEELADQEAQRRLLAAGVISEIKPSRRVSTWTEQFTPVSIQGESLSETIIRERALRWPHISWIPSRSSRDMSRRRSSTSAAGCDGRAAGVSGRGYSLLSGGSVRGNVDL